MYAAELAGLAADGSGLQVDFVYTREAPPGWLEPIGRVRPDQLLSGVGGQPTESAFVCGPTGFVEAVANVLASSALPANRIRTERFGPTGG
jgi:ferredoxin-NADP reductase